MPLIAIAYRKGTHSDVYFSELFMLPQFRLPPMLPAQPISIRLTGLSNSLGIESQRVKIH